MVSASTGAMNSVLSKLATLLEDELNPRTRNSIVALRCALTSMRSFLERRAASTEDMGPLVEGWMNQVRDMTYDLEDSIDDFVLSAVPCNTNRVAQLLKMVTLRRQYTILLKELKEQVCEASERRWSAHWGNSLVGVEGPRDRLVKLLDPDGKKQLKLVSIVGSRVGVQEYDFRQYDEEQLIHTLSEFLKTRRYFIVIEDIWDVSAWKLIRWAFPDNVFPEGYVIDKARLIRRWIGEGFIIEEHGKSSEEVGECYFNELINRGLIQPVCIRYDGRIEACQVQNMILDFILSISAEENFVTRYDNPGCISGLQHRIRRLSHGKEDRFIPYAINASHIRSLTIFMNDKEMPILANFRALRVLDIEYSGELQDASFLQNIGKASMLKYLRLQTTPGNSTNIGKQSLLKDLQLQTTPECQKGAQSSTTYCKAAHAGGQLCEQLGCTKRAKGMTDYCTAHGGGRRCEHPDYPKAARGMSGQCIKHGGMKRCPVEGCIRSAEAKSGLCISHGGVRVYQYPYCIKDAQGSTLYCKAHDGGKGCIFDRCSKSAEGSTLFCKSHGRGKRCMFEGDIDCKDAEASEVEAVESAIWGVICAHPGHPGLELRRLGEEDLMMDEVEITPLDEGAEGCRDEESEEMVNEMATGSKTQERKPSPELPMELSYEFLENITNYFSDEHEISVSPFGTLYKGTVPYGGTVIAVKKLQENTPMPADKTFEKEVQNVMALKHENIVELVGFCSETTKKLVWFHEEYIVTDATERLLCYEYLPNGSLQKILFGTKAAKDVSSSKPNIRWGTRFKIIKEICQGLRFLHELDNPIIHMDLNPENILLDGNMVPKIADFALSRLFGQDQTRLYTQRVAGSHQYMAPEYVYSGEISTQSDIYSLGLLIIEITTGEQSCPESYHPSARKFIDKVREDGTLEHIASKYALLDLECLMQVKACINIGLKCLEIDWRCRPSIVEIVDMLNRIGSSQMVNEVCRRRWTRITCWKARLYLMTDPSKGGSDWSKPGRLVDAADRSSPAELKYPKILSSTHRVVFFFNNQDSSRDMNGSIPVSSANSSGPSIGVSSLVTDGNSSLSGGAQFQHSTSMNADSFMRLPSSPMSFSSNNISGSSVIDGSTLQQSPPQEQMQKRRSSSATSQPGIEADGAFHGQKKPRVDIRQDDILQQHLIQQLLQGQSSLHFQGQHNPQLQALIRQQKLAHIQHLQQHQLSQQFPQIQQSQIGIPRQPQLRPPLAQPGMQLPGPVRTPVESGLCSRRLMQYLYHKRQRPENNPITYWRKLIDEYFAPQARERWCVSSYEKRGNSPVVIPQTARDTWRCDICNTHTGKGYEATHEILPRLCQIRFDHGVVDEYLFLDVPNEFRLPNGLLLLEHTKVVQKSIYDHLHVTHEGQLRIIFTPELKIMSWEFCSRRHDEYITRRFLAPQVNHLLQIAQKYQAATNESGPAGVSANDAEAICNLFVSASEQLAKNLDRHSLNEHGLSKRYVRCLQISEVVNNMKDLIEFSHKNKLGPIESLKNYPRQMGPKLTMQNMHEAKGTSMEMSTHGNNNEAPGMHNGVQLDVSRSFRAGQLGQFQQHPMSFQQAMPQHQQNSFGAGVSTQYQQHLIQQLLQEAKSSNNRIMVQQQQQPTSAGAVITNSPASGEAHDMNSGAAKGAPPASTTGPSNLINSAAGMVQRCSSFKSVSSNPAAAVATSGGNPVSPKAESMHEVPELDHLISSELAESGLFLEEQQGGGAYSWNM
ncbi:hypothetical protein ZWY2020_000404 [Hordeum vulgare]|nr:hypothetical protein ZWY2020_000404 [Hordeum vulgare]